jgi:hypothetical protein
MMPGSGKRQHTRFSPPAATLVYEIHGLFGRRSREICPVLNLSKGGLCFRTNTGLKPGSMLLLTLTYAVEETPIRLFARIVYRIPHPGMNYRYHIGVVFMPFGSGRGCNSQEALQVLECLERRFDMLQPGAVAEANA